MARAVTKCPGCGEPVSPFAAGCAICGADLEAERIRLAARPRSPLAARPRPRFPLRVPGVLDPVHVVIAIIVAIAAPPFGLLLSLFWAVQRQRAGETLMAAVMLAVALLAIGALLAPYWFWSHLLSL